MLRKQLVAVLFCFLMSITAVNGVSAQATSPDAADGAVAATTVTDRINLNTADLEMLTTLPGIGPKTAEKIEEYRKTHGPFQSVDELLQVKGIGPKILEKLKSLVTVS